MASQAVVPAEKQGLLQLACMGVRQGKLQPAFRDLSNELLTLVQRVATTFHFLPVVLQADSLHLHFTGAGLTRLDRRFFRAVLCESLSPGTSRLLPQLQRHHQ